MMRLKAKKMGPILALGGIGSILGAALAALIGGPEVGYAGTVIGALGGAISGFLAATWFRLSTIRSSRVNAESD